jgi:D-inositol-3-phosphate glycosyltransferase
LPLSLLEAMAAGVPAIATAVCGTKDVLRNPNPAADGGLLVPPHDAAALAAAMTKVAHDRGLRDQLSRNASARAREYTWGRTAAGLAHAYESAIASADSRG